MFSESGGTFYIAPSLDPLPPPPPPSPSPSEKRRRNNLWVNAERPVKSGYHRQSPHDPSSCGRPMKHVDRWRVMVVDTPNDGEGSVKAYRNGTCICVLQCSLCFQRLGIQFAKFAPHTHTHMYAHAHTRARTHTCTHARTHRSRRHTHILHTHPPTHTYPHVHTPHIPPPSHTHTL